jgi:hypothetical protein
MKSLITALLLLFLSANVSAEAIASMPNRAGGKIVLTNEACVYKNKTYDGLKRAYNYSTEGYTTEGCFMIEDETVVVIWNDGTANSKMRYPAENFTIINRKRGTQI